MQEVPKSAPCPLCLPLPPCVQHNVSLHALVDAKVPSEVLEAEKDAQFFWDENHPWDRTGHRHVGGLVVRAG